LPIVRSLFAALFATSLSWTTATAAPLSPELSVGVRFVGFFIGLVIAIAVHEAGHLVCAWATGTPVRQMTVGAGPLLFRRRISETWFELRLLPTLGFVVNYPAAIVHRARIALFLLGGVLANAAVVVAIGVVTTRHAMPAWTDDVIGALVFTQLWLVLVNLMPFTVDIGQGRIASDGGQLLQLWLLTSGEPTAAGKVYAQMLAAYSAGAPLPRPTQASSRIMYHVFRNDRWTDMEAAAEFVAAMQRELARGDLPVAEEALVLDALVTHALTVGDADLRSELEALARRALMLAPSDTLTGSHGAALVEMGRHAEGKAVLEALIARGKLNPFDLFMTEVHLARAECGLGDREAAARWAVAARKSAEISATPAVACMLARMEAELARAMLA
jgi:Peptidase family M50